MKPIKPRSETGVFIWTISFRKTDYVTYSFLKALLILNAHLFNTSNGNKGCKILI